MAHELLGETFDIHAGGIDLQFPHHENEIAQSRCAHPEGQFARYWLHNEMLQVEGKKMSKSLGNFFTVRDLLDQRVPGEVIRFVMLQTHYGKPMDWTTFARWQALKSGTVDYLEDFQGDRSQQLIGAAMCFVASSNLIGLLQGSPGASVEIEGDKVVDVVERILEIRSRARSEKDWPTADMIRDGLKAAGIRVKDMEGRTTWTIEKDELDGLLYFNAVRSAQSSTDEALLQAELRRAREAGLHFSNIDHLDTSPAWRSVPSRQHILTTLEPLIARLEALK
jgi:cysteinyl-tRNA synthetase